MLLNLKHPFVIFFCLFSSLFLCVHVCVCSIAVKALLEYNVHTEIKEKKIQKTDYPKAQGYNIRAVYLYPAQGTIK